MDQPKSAMFSPGTPSRKKTSNGSGGQGTPGSGKKVRTGIRDFDVGTRLEAKDFNGKWWQARIAEVDWEEREVLIHFEKWADRYDEWVPMDSSRMRPLRELPPEPKPVVVERRFKVGEQVMATWSNNIKYPGTIFNTEPNDRYDVLFYDGYRKSVRGSKISKIKESEQGQVQLKMQQMQKQHLQIQQKKQQLQMHQSQPHTQKPQQQLQQQSQPFQLPLQQPQQQRQVKKHLQNGLVHGPSNLQAQSSKTVQGQTQLEQRLLQPQTQSVQYAPILPSVATPTPVVDGLLPVDENIGTKEQRRERKRKLNVKELFSSKRPRGSAAEKHSREKKGAHGTSSFSGSRNVMEDGSPHRAMSPLSPPIGSSPGAQSPGNGLLMGVDPMFPANPMKVEGGFLPPPTQDHEVLDTSSGEIKRKRKRMKKKVMYTAPFSDYEGESSEPSPSGGAPSKKMRAQLSPDDEDEECSIQWTNGEPQGEAAYVIESAEGLRKSIIVDDRRLPAGWSKHAIRRQGGTSAGKWDVFLVRPENSSSGAAAVSGASSDSQLTPPSPSHSPAPAPTPPLPQAMHPPAPHSITPQVTAHGIQRVKTLLPRVRTPTAGSPSRRVMSPPPPHAIPPQPIVPTPPPSELSSKKSLSAGRDGYECPKDGCEKRFRKENLLQMHIKHYHPEYTAFMGSTPNVADLAYARTVGEPVAEMPSRSRGTNSTSFMEKIEKISRMEANRKAGSATDVPTSDGLSSLEARSPTLGLLLKKGPMRKDSVDGTTAAAQAAAAWMVETASDSALTTTSPASGIPYLPDSSRDPLRDHKSSLSPVGVGLDNLMEVSSRPSSRAAGMPSEIGSDQEVGSEHASVSPWKMGSNANVPGSDGIHSVSASSSPIPAQPPSFFYSKKKNSSSLIEKHHTDPFKHSEEGKPASPPAAEHLRRGELINCTCGFTEEDGLMIQCDLCLCWQHGTCNKIENVDDVPEKYVCHICLNPMRERRSRHYVHDQDWLKEGSLPTLPIVKRDPEVQQKREDLLKRSHDLCALLLQMQKIIHSVRVKVHIAEQKDHPKLYLWANSWVEESANCPTPPSSPIPDAGIQPKIEPIDAPRVPQPEAPIDPRECRLKLLEHIEHFQSVIDARLSALEEQITALELEDPTLLDENAPPEWARGKKAADLEDTDTPSDESNEFFPQTKETMQMLLRDLLVMRKIATL